MALNFFNIDGEIPWTSQLPIPNAKKAIKDYHNHPDKFKFPDGNVVKGFSFKKSDLEGMLRNPGVDRVMFALGYHDGTVTSGLTGFTVIMIGINEADGVYYLMIDSALHKVYDYCEPCPPKCTVPDLAEL